MFAGFRVSLVLWLKQNVRARRNRWFARKAPIAKDPFSE